MNHGRSGASSGGLRLPHLVNKLYAYGSSPTVNGLRGPSQGPALDRITLTWALKKKPATARGKALLKPSGENIKTLEGNMQEGL